MAKIWRSNLGQLNHWIRWGVAILSTTHHTTYEYGVCSCETYSSRDQLERAQRTASQIADRNTEETALHHRITVVLFRVQLLLEP